MKRYYEIMPFGTSKECVCNECNEKFFHAKKLSEHLKTIHRVTSVEYVVKHLYGGTKPLCIECGEEPRFVSLTKGFKKYCKEHAKTAESRAGKIGGKIKKTWSKGKTKETDERLIQQSIRQTGSGNPFYGKKHTEETKLQIASSKRLSMDEVTKRILECVPCITLLSTEYVDQNTPLSIQCNVCQTKDDVTLCNIQRCWRCRKCYPVGSRQQLEVVDFVKSFGFSNVEISTRSVIPPFELDVWIPSKNVAIEYHGLYWHSGGKDGVFDRHRHRQKFEACAAKGIRLLQFFSDEWINHTDVCKSIIANALGESRIKLHARDCKVELISPQLSKAFCNANHVSGSTRASHHVGLIHRTHGLIGVASTRTPIQKKWGKVAELARMCFLQNVSVRGGASKLLTFIKELVKKDGFEGLLSYAELRYGTGTVYEKCGMTLVTTALNNYWYTNGEVRFNRFKYRAQPGKTEKQVADENQVRPVYGCGNNVYLIKL